MKISLNLLFICLTLQLIGQSTYLERTSPNPASAQLFFFARTSNNVTDQNWKIATLPASTASTGDKIMIELFGGSHGSTSTFQQVIHMGNRNAFSGYLRTSYGEPYVSVRIRAYQQTDGSIDVYFSLLANGWKGGSVRVYEGSGIVSTRPTIYENPVNVGATPVGTLVFDSYSVTPGLVVRNDGNVGIGTSNAAARLHIHGNGGSASGYRVSNSSDNVRGYFVNDNNNSDYLISYANSGGAEIEFQSDGDVILAQAGNVGIGTDNPLERLHVDGITSIEADIGEPTESYWKTGNHTLELQNNDGGEVILSFHRAGYNSASIKSPIEGGLILSGRGSNSYEDLYIDRNSNIGIGTTTPTHKLEVNGTIRSKEVKVEASPWPDYVFEPDYNLLSLEEIEAFIKSEKHLPEIPSAKEMETNGVKLGEMNMLLLKKIEELTLHQIELLKEIKELKATTEIQQKEIEKLKSE